MWKVFEQGTDEYGPIGHGWTYSAHPIGAAAGIANLKLIDDLGLMQNAGDVGAYLNAQMQAAIGDHPHVGEVRGEGMMCAVEFVKDKDSRTFFDPSQKIGPQIAGALVEKKSHWSRDATRRHSGFCPAILPDQTRGRRSCVQNRRCGQSDGLFLNANCVERAQN